MKQLIKLEDVSYKTDGVEDWLDCIDNDAGDIFWSMIEHDIIGEVINFYVESSVYSVEFFQKFYDWITYSEYELALNYYVSHSSEKYISPLYRKYISKYWTDESDNTQFQDMNDRLAKFILNKFFVKWTQIFNAITTEYKPLENYNMEEIRTPDIAKSRSGSETGSHRETGHEETNTDMTNAKDVSSESGIYGFNSTESNPTASGTGDEDVHITGDKDDNYIDRTSSGSSNGSHSETETETGTETLTRHGNIGVTTSQQMLESEIKLRQYNFVEQMFKDIDSILCLKIY